VGFFAILFTTLASALGGQAVRWSHVGQAPVSLMVPNWVQFDANARYRPETFAAARWYWLINTFNLSQTECKVKQRLISRDEFPSW
jgi:hypothetical protein